MHFGDAGRHLILLQTDVHSCFFFVCVSLSVVNTSRYNIIYNIYIYIYIIIIIYYYTVIEQYIRFNSC